MDDTEFKKRLAECQVGYVELDFDGYFIGDGEAMLNAALLQDEDLNDAQRQGLREFVNSESNPIGWGDSGSTNYHEAVMVLEAKMEKDKKLLKIAKKGAKARAAGQNYVVEDRKRKLKAELSEFDFPNLG